VITRRAFVGTLAGGLLTAPLAAEGQRAEKVYRIGLLQSKLPSIPPGQGPFHERMRELGWVYGRDFVTERREFSGQYEREPDLAAELTRAGVDIKRCASPTPWTRVSRRGSEKEEDRLCRLDPNMSITAGRSTSPARQSVLDRQR